MSLGIWLAERGYVPDPLIAWGIRGLLRERIAINRQSPMQRRQRYEALVQELRRTPVAIHTKEANEQHYEVPTAFFERALGRHLKYSGCYYRPGVTSLDQAEADMLRLSCRRAGLRDGQTILELGCGWGSLTLWMAEHYPNSRILGVSNSRTQKVFIEEKARERGLRNIEIRTCDVNRLELEEGRFDRVMSVEMLEHVRNYQQLFARIARWMKPDGRFFVHIFTHGTDPYPFETEGSDNWMGRYFFTGGLMPSDDLFYHFQKDLVIEKHWRVNGRHYEKTARGWLANMDARREEILPILAEAYGRKDAALWFQRWRIFFMACAELWGFNGGREWMVSHYVFSPRPSAVRQLPAAQRAKSGPVSA